MQTNTNTPTNKHVNLEQTKSTNTHNKKHKTKLTIHNAPQTQYQHRLYIFTTFMIMHFDNDNIYT